MMILLHPTETEIALYYDGHLNKTDTAKVKEHLEECEDCRAQYELYCQAMQPLKKDLGYWWDRFWFGWVTWPRIWRRILEAEESLRHAL